MNVVCVACKREIRNLSRAKTKGGGTGGWVHLTCEVEQDNSIVFSDGDIECGCGSDDFSLQAELRVTARFGGPGYDGEPWYMDDDIVHIEDWVLDDDGEVMDREVLRWSVVCVRCSASRELLEDRICAHY
jgi:hypothetical protein